MPLDSALYYGHVRHRRLTPHPHQFSYSLMQWWLALDELEQVDSLSRWLSTSARRAPLHFKATDYLRGDWQGADSLQVAVLNKFRQLGSAELSGRVFFLGNIRCWGLYFSPLNCYFLQRADGQFSHMLAEVSNTPWNQRHYYLVDLEQQADTAKAFHVSPFNPMNMQYHWTIRAPTQRCLIRIEASLLTSNPANKQPPQKSFDAAMALQRTLLERQAITRALVRHPFMTLKTLAGIYWQAVRLFIRRTPFYSNPPRSD